LFFANESIARTLSNAFFFLSFALGVCSIGKLDSRQIRHTAIHHDSVIQFLRARIVCEKPINGILNDILLLLFWLEQVEPSGSRSELVNSAKAGTNKSSRSIGSNLLSRRQGSRSLGLASKVCQREVGRIDCLSFEGTTHRSGEEFRRGCASALWSYMLTGFLGLLLRNHEKTEWSRRHLDHQATPATTTYYYVAVVGSSNVVTAADQTKPNQCGGDSAVGIRISIKSIFFYFFLLPPPRLQLRGCAAKKSIAVY
jgi:hypothetical protein